MEREAFWRKVVDIKYGILASDWYTNIVTDTKYGWKNHINSRIDSFFRSQICIDSYILEFVSTKLPL